jgi:transcriptional regulator with XRE-family HTH domain
MDSKSLTELKAPFAPLAGGLTVAMYIERRIRELAQDGVKQRDIADAAGFNRPNVLSMIKQGETKLPLDKIGRMAIALRVDRRFLFELTIWEYEPELWDIAKDVFGAEMFLTTHEQRLVNQLRTDGVRLEAIPLDEFDDRISRIGAVLG